MFGWALHRAISGCWMLLVVLCVACAASPPRPPAESRYALVTFHADEAAIRLLAGGSPRTYYSDGEWAVSLQVSRTVSRISKSYALRQVDAWPIKSLDLHCVVFEVPDEEDLDRLVARIAEEPGVDGAQPMHEFEGRGLAGAETTNPRFALQYGVFSDRVIALHRLTRGASSRVGMVDTLVDENHPDLRDQIARQYAFVSEPGGNLLHGTAVAGVISANGGDGDGVVGLAPDAKMYVYGACWALGASGARCNSFTIAKALEQATEDGVEILNLSLSGPSDPLLARQLSVLLARGVIVVAATDPTRGSGGFPASLQGVLAVDGSSTETRGPEMITKPSCADWIFDAERLSTRARGGYQFFYGSSMSAAAASGFAALLRSRTGSVEAADELRTMVVGNDAPTEDRSNFLAEVRDALRCEGPSQSVTADRGL